MNGENQPKIGIAAPCEIFLTAGCKIDFLYFDNTTAI